MYVLKKSTAKVVNINGIAKQIAIKMQFCFLFLTKTAFLYQETATNNGLHGFYGFLCKVSRCLLPTPSFKATYSLIQSYRLPHSKVPVSNDLDAT